MSAATSKASRATWSRSASTCCASRSRKAVQAQAELAAEERLISTLVGDTAAADTRSKFRRMLRSGELDEREIEIAISEPQGMPIGQLDIPGMPPGQVINLNDMMKNMFGGGRPAQKRRMTVAAARAALEREEADRLLDNDRLAKDAVAHAENNGIVFIDEIDKVCARTMEGGFRGGDVSREGVQRDLLPLIEGTTVSTKYGPVKTDHVLFIASGAFHLAKPSDLLPELQGRLPIRVELAPLSREDLRRILTEPEHSLMKQTAALLATERVELVFADSAIDALAELAADINDRVENIGARRLHTVLEKLLEEISFTAVRPRRRNDHGRCGVCERAGGAAGAEGRSESIYSVIVSTCACRGGSAQSPKVANMPTAAAAMTAVASQPRLLSHGL